MAIDKTSLYQRLGGTGALRATLNIFYARLTKDKELKDFFKGINMAKLKLHQLHFLKMAFTQIPKEVNAADKITQAHMRLFVEKGLNADHFDLVAGHLVAALKQLKVPDDLVDEVVGIVGPLRGVFEEAAEKYGGSGEKKPLVEESSTDKTSMVET